MSGIFLRQSTRTPFSTLIGKLISRANKGKGKGKNKEKQHKMIYNSTKVQFSKDTIKLYS
jgi:hypothetical protein